MTISTSLIIQLIGGAIGGNLAGMVMKKFSLGIIGNSALGILGGGIGGQLLTTLGVHINRGGPNLESITGSILSGAVGGGVLIIIVGIIKKALS